MKNKIMQYTAAYDVNSIVFDASNARIYITSTQENELKISCEKSKEWHISCNEGVLTVKQSPRFRLFGKKKATVEMLVPDHILPDILIDGKNCSVLVNGGIYNQLSLVCDDGAAELYDCSFSGCELTGVALNTNLKGVTVKNALVVKCDCGNMIWENSFAACTECRVKRGNIGLSGFNCKNSIMEAENGNVAAQLGGEENDYNLGLLVKEGTANRESVQREGAARSFKAYSAKGNIAIDFLPSNENYEIGDN